MAGVVGIDLGGTHYRVGRVGRDGRVSAWVEGMTYPERGPEDVLGRLARAVRPLRPSRVGIGCPGPLDPDTGVLRMAPNLPGWRNVPVGPCLSGLLGVPVSLENDATLAAWGEYVRGAGRGKDPFLLITLGTGVGGGLIVGGAMLGRGAGEVGHVRAAPGGRRCGCGGRGCLEAYASATAMVARARALGWKGTDARSLFCAARGGHPAAQRVIREAAELLGRVVRDLAEVLGPLHVALGGQVARGGRVLTDPLRAYLAANRPISTGRPVPVFRARLGNRAGVVGAAEWVRTGSATSASSPISTTARARWRIASSS